MKCALLAAVAALLHCPATAADPPGYPRGNLLLEPAALATPALVKEFVVLDARDRNAFDEGRIPGARWVDAAAWANAFYAGRDAAAWSSRIGGLGVGRESKVVLYDDNSAKDAARIWWILRYWGLSDVRLLNGQWAGWKAAGLPIETGKPTVPAPQTLPLAPQAKRLATKADLLGALKDNSLQVVDARSEGEFCGLAKGKNKHAGAIPGAAHLEWSNLLDKQTQRFKSAAQLAALFRRAGIQLPRPSVTYCQSGGRASVMAFTMELMGAPDARVYYASWREWGNADDTPIAAGKSGPGKAPPPPESK